MTLFVVITEIIAFLLNTLVMGLFMYISFRKGYVIGWIDSDNYIINYHFKKAVDKQRYKEEK